MSLLLTLSTEYQSENREWVHIQSLHIRNIREFGWLRFKISTICLFGLKWDRNTKIQWIITLDFWIRRKISRIKRKKRKSEERIDQSLKKNNRMFRRNRKIQIFEDILLQFSKLSSNLLILKYKDNKMHSFENFPDNHHGMVRLTPRSY